MCGEQHSNQLNTMCPLGSPPRVRGTAYGCNFSGVQGRITPACAGNSVSVAYKEITLEDHPRVCGEQSIFPISKRACVGSPPRVRGTAFDFPRAGPLCGITPACAGNSAFRPHCSMARKDHPRVCGEQHRSSPRLSNLLGSPPRVRGTVPFAVVLPVLVRITPACAGNRVSRLTMSVDVWDHPRVCGEQDYTKIMYCRWMGSPPRVRGTVSRP